MRLRDLDPAVLAEQAHEHCLGRLTGLAFALGYDLHEGGAGVSEARHAVHQLAHYARTGVPPEGRAELVHEYLISLIPLDLLPPSGDPEEPDPTAPEAVQGVHLVVLAVLAREALRQDQPVTSAQLAALGSLTSSAVRAHLVSGELRRWRAGPARGDRRAYVHPEDARRWLGARGVST